jgi:TonB family protein
MSTAVANPVNLNLRSYFGYSLILHASLFVLIFVGSFLERGQDWGGPGSPTSGTRVSLVPAASIPLPKETSVTESKAVDPTESLHKEEPPQPKPPEPKTDAEKIPKFTKEQPPPPSRKSRVLENKTKEPDNAIPGHGGTPPLPTGMAQTPGNSAPGVAAVGQGGGDFAARYPWYVDAIRNRISQSWDQSAIEPGVRAAHRAHTVMTFRINSNGSISNIRMMQTSGNSSMDYSAQRALQSIDAFRALPNDYMGSYVDVTFDFDLSLPQ